MHHTPFLYSFTDHGIEHSKRMLVYINKLLSNTQNTDLLNEYECFVLASAIYLHDIGIQVTKDELLFDFAKKNGLQFDPNDNKADFVRKYHPQLSSYIIRNDLREQAHPIVYFGEKPLGEYICLVVESHGIDFYNNDSYCIKNFHGEDINIKLLSILLCLADCFDCDDQRIDTSRFRYAELISTSRIHWMKHYYVSGISIHNRIITIYYSFPILNTHEDNVYQSYFIYETEYWIKRIIEQYKNELNNANLIFEVDSAIDHRDYQNKINEEDLSYIEEIVFDRIIQSETIAHRRITIGVLNNHGRLLMACRKIPETNQSNGHKLEWQFPSTTVVTNKPPEKQIIEMLNQDIGIKCIIKKKIGSRLHPDTKTLCFYFALEYLSGNITKSDTRDFKQIKWIPISEYKNLITSDLYWRIEKYIEEELDNES